MDASVKEQVNEMLLRGDLQGAIDALVEHLLAHNKLYAADFVALKSRLASLEGDRASGVLDYAGYQLERNKILNAFLITFENLDQPLPTLNNRDGNVVRRGKLCHNIPDELVLNQRQKCKVRIADTEEILRQGIELPDNARIEDIDIANVMKVSIFDPSEGENFRIVSGGDDDEHVLTEMGSTWTFYITSLKVGQHDLQLNVFCVINVNGKEKKSLLSFDKLIEVRSAAPAAAVGEKWQDLNVQIGGQEREAGGSLLSRMFRARKRTMAVALVFVSLGMFAMFNGGNTGGFFNLDWFNTDPKPPPPPDLKDTTALDLAPPRDAAIPQDTAAQREELLVPTTPAESQLKSPEATPPALQAKTEPPVKKLATEVEAKAQAAAVPEPEDAPLPEEPIKEVVEDKAPATPSSVPEDTVVTESVPQPEIPERSTPEPVRFRIVAELEAGRTVNLGERITIRVNTKGVSARDILVYVDGRRKDTMLEGNSLVLFLPARMNKYGLKVVHVPSGSDINGKLTGTKNATITVIDRLRRQ